MRLLSAKSALLAIVIFLSNIFFINAGGVEQPQNIYLAANGDDRGDGSAQRPFLTLKKAHAAVAAIYKLRPDAHVQVFIRGGVYYGQTLVWTAVPRAGSLIIRGYGSTKPVFDGRAHANAAVGSTVSLLSLRPAKAGQYNITISHLRLQNYLEGIDLIAPSRDIITQGISGLVLEHLEFYKIGSEHAAVLDATGKRRAGLAAIRMVNVKQSQFRYNDFKDLYNLGHSGGSQHAYYAAHYSSNNTFYGNRFIRNLSGHAIKIRDFSNDNLIHYNYFESVTPTALQIWHCEKKDRSDCTKAGLGESRSYNTKETKNIYINTEKYSVFKERVGQNNPLPYPGGVYDFIKDGTTYLRYIVRSQLNGRTLVGICERATDCISSTARCYKDQSGTQNHKCEKGNWVAR
ncbi:hypothetical protein [Bdellovibrio bacteriovorus]|uniref:hypothetical protein n=1 Tax=Bdellovibrio bacteriovorus TaxID=959 RepID=UPI003AA85BBF